ncbi:MAG TPA: hypothetical protein VFS28_01175 [Gemmatimonadales bacterium]|nr:hypothetical protein [Gemmatimonadales bacterium]
MTVHIVGIVTLVGAILIWLTAWVVATRRPAAAIEEVRPRIYRVRRGYFFALTTVLVVALVLTLQHTPYVSAKTRPPAVTLSVNGMMWAWQIASSDTAGRAAGRAVVPVGQPVMIEVGSYDVNHAFGIYRPDGTLLGQLQAMPGYRNRMEVVFPAPGIYHVACLEYCGLGHHQMFAELEAR